MIQILLATNNAGKRKEFQDIFRELTNIHLVTPTELNLKLDVDEVGNTYLENAALKAKAFADVSGLISLADDSGLEVDALDGAPGLHSARFLSDPKATDAERRSYLVSLLGKYPRPWKARFQCVIVISDKDGNEHPFPGTCEGEIIPEEKGENGFGYDPIFYISSLAKTMAEISDEEKNRISHRAVAAMSAIPFMKTL
ncbi:MAG: RdgB/HAM1 family non-canonical purine NTP pyrophosphatase [Anaerolineales bacterium]|nr:RdgB/HAM1 family non-canonical purine NTP pyrophosphatase [Anaerolineales bacterium]